MPSPFEAALTGHTKGPNLAPNSACSTAAHAIADAARLIATGEADVMVAGAAESCIHPLAFTGFERLKGLTTSSNEEPRRASRPFSDDRDGFVIGEGAGVMVLEVKYPRIIIIPTTTRPSYEPL